MTNIATGLFAERSYEFFHVSFRTRAEYVFLWKASVSVPSARCGCLECEPHWAAIERGAAKPGKRAVSRLMRNSTDYNNNKLNRT